LNFGFQKEREKNGKRPIGPLPKGNNPHIRKKNKEEGGGGSKKKKNKPRKRQDKQLGEKKPNHWQRGWVKN